MHRKCFNLASWSDATQISIQLEIPYFPNEYANA